MIQSHDSATGEILEERDKIIVKWTRTQEGTIVQQLDCGTRALDYRPFLHENGTLYAHHGPSVIFKPLEETLAEIQEWGTRNPTELVVISLSHCVTERFHNNYYADSCHDALLELLNQKNIHTVTDCTELADMTMEDALQGGTILAEVGCSSGYWDPSLTCSDKDYICYDSWPEGTKTIPWTNLQNFLLTSASTFPAEGGKFWGYGANWQSSAESVVFGTLHNSSLILDEVRSDLNAWTASLIQSGQLQYIGMLGVDNVCHNGLSIYEALQVYNSK